MTAHPAIRLLHDVGAATWFGGSLMGATGLNGATALLDDPAERARVSTAGWSRWTPVNAAGVAAHVVGAVGLTLTDSPRVLGQSGVMKSSLVKAGVTAAGLGVGAWSVALNRAMAAAGPVPVDGPTDPAARTPSDVASVQRKLKAVQWLNPLLAGAVIAVGSWQSEQQRAAQVAPGVIKRVGQALPGSGPLAAAAPALGLAAAGAVLVARRRRRTTASTVDAYPTPPVVQHPAPGSGVVDLSTRDEPAGLDDPPAS